MKRYILTILIGASATGILGAAGFSSDFSVSTPAVADEALDVSVVEWSSTDDPDEFILPETQLSLSSPGTLIYVGSPASRASARLLSLPRVRAPPGSHFS
jgi:hypothetical protein